MSENRTPSQGRPRAWRLAVGAALVLALSLAGFYLVMQPSAADFRLMALFLSVTAVVTVLAGYAAYSMGWMGRMPSLRLALLGTYALSSALTLLNVWLTARLMFASQHDLTLATILLLFAGGMALALGWFFAATFGMRIEALRHAARRFAQGDRSARVEIKGRDELSDLARTFNEMAARVESAALEQQELERLRRELIAWTSHDLQTPLASMRAVVEALADGVIKTPQARSRYMNALRREIDALSQLIDDLLQMARLDAGGLQLEREPASLSDLLSDTLESFSEVAARQGIRLSGGVQGDIDPVLIDAPRIGRVLANLVRNALQHSHPGDSVTLSARRAGSWVEVCIEDTGEGIPADELPTIFERFQRGEKSRSRATGGSGLGLAIARGLVEAHGGDISAESEAGAGTTIRFRLPA